MKKCIIPVYILLPKPDNFSLKYLGLKKYRYDFF